MRRAAVTIVAAAALRQPQRANRAVTRRAAAADAFAGLGEGFVAPLAPAAAAVDPFARLGEGVVAAPPDATPLSAPALLLLLAAVGAAALVWLGQNLEPNPDARAALGLPEPNPDARAALGLPAAAAARPELFAASDAKAYYVVRWRARGRRGRHAIIIAARGCLEPVAVVPRLVLDSWPRRRRRGRSTRPQDPSRPWPRPASTLLCAASRCSRRIA